MKKFFSAILLMAAMAFSVSTFVSCNDLTQEMEDVKAQATQNAAAIDALETQITALQSALATAQATADAAKKAGEDAAAAAAQAKADAIKEAKAECEIVKAALEAKIAEINTALAGKASKEELQAAIDQATAGLNDLAATLGAKIEGIEAGLNKMATVAQLDEEVAKLLAADQELALQIAALKAYSDTTYATVEEAEAIREELTNLANENYNELQKLIGLNGSAIQATIDSVDVVAAALKGYMESNDSRINEIAKAVAAAGDDIAAIEEALKAYMPETDAKIAENAQKIAAVNELLDQTVEQVAERINGVEANMKTYYDVLTASVEDLGTELRAEIAAVKAGLEALTPRVTTLEANVTTINNGLSTLKTLVESLLRSITFAPDFFVDGVEAIRFNSIAYAPMAPEHDTWYAKVNPKDNCETNEDTYRDRCDYTPTTADLRGDYYKKALSVSELAVASYHFNPSNFNLADANYEFIARAAQNVNCVDTKADDFVLFEIETEEAKYLGGFTSNPQKNADEATVDFQLRRGNVVHTAAKAPLMNLAALEAVYTNDKNEEVVIRSPYVLVNDNIINANDLFIADQRAHSAGHFHFATYMEEAMEMAPLFEVYYDDVFDLRSLVMTCVDGEAFDIAAYELDYRFYVADREYFIGSIETDTNQQTVIECTDAVKGLYAIPEAISREAIGRTPILKVEIVDEADNIVRRGYVKVKVTAQRAETWEVKKNENLTFKCADTKAHFELNEEWMRQNVYRAIENIHGVRSLSHQEFWDIYGYDVKYDNVPETVVYKTPYAKKEHTLPAPAIVDGVTADGRETKIITWDFKHGQIGTIGYGQEVVLNASVVLYNKYADASEYPTKVTLGFVVKVTLPTVTDDFKKLTTADGKPLFWNADNEWLVNVNVPQSPEEGDRNCQFNQKIDEAWQSITISNTANVKCFTRYYRVDPDWALENAKLAEGITIYGNPEYITLDRGNNDIKKQLNSEDGLVVPLQCVYVFGNKDEHVIENFYVRFVRPVNLNLPVGLSVRDGEDGGDLLEFATADLLTDWRNKLITPPYGYKYIINESHWQLTCRDEVVWVPETQRVKTPAYWEVEWTEKAIEKEVTVYGAKATVAKLTIFQEPETKAIEVEAKYATPEAAKVALDIKLTELNYPLDGNFYAYAGEVETTTATTREAVAYIPVAEPIYHPAEFEVVPGYETTVPAHDGSHTAYPAVDGTKNGEVNGCWTWYEAYRDGYDFNWGEYWFFYGIAGVYAPNEDGTWVEEPYLKLDLRNNMIETNLSSGKLPEKASVTQDGLTLRYHNIESPVGGTYEIRIPASVDYVWGTLKGTLTVTVNPVAQPAE